MARPVSSDASCHHHCLVPLAVRHASRATYRANLEQGLRRRGVVGTNGPGRSTQSFGVLLPEAIGSVVGRLASRTCCRRPQRQRVANHFFLRVDGEKRRPAEYQAPFCSRGCSCICGIPSATTGSASPGPRGDDLRLRLRWCPWLACGDARLLTACIAQPPPSSPHTGALEGPATRRRQAGAGIDGEFVKRLVKLLPVLIPGPLCKETFYLALVAALMIVRTLCDIWQIRNGTSIESAIITRNKKGFFKYLLRFGFAMVPIACINNLLKYGQLCPSPALTTCSNTVS
jgi:hypothetical protein